MGKAQSPAPAGGVYAALLTPRKQGTTDADAAGMLDYLDRVVNTGVDGLVLFGSTGEFVHFDVAERARVVNLAVRRSRVPVLVNITHSTMLGTMELAESALKVGIAGVLLMPPYFYRYDDNDLFAFYKQMLSILGGQTSLYLYNLPMFTNPLSFELVRSLLSLPGVAGIKDSSGDPELFGRLRELRRLQNFQLLIGSERLYAQERMRGADGAISGISAGVPELMVTLERATIAGDTGRINLLSAFLNEFVGWVEMFPAVMAIRETAALRGWIKNEPVLPAAPETERRLVEFRGWLKEWLPLVVSECAVRR